MVSSTHQFHCRGYAPACNVDIFARHEKMAAHRKQSGACIHEIANARIIAYRCITLCPPVVYGLFIHSWAAHSFIPFNLAQPEPNMCGLYRFLDDCKQVVGQGCQIHILAHTEPRAESGQLLGGVVLTTVETPINRALNTSSQWLEQGCDPERRANDSQLVNPREAV